MSSVSESAISIFDESITEFSTCGLSPRTDRSKSPLYYFKDERISVSELVSAWLVRMEIPSSELLDIEEEPLEQVYNTEEKMERVQRMIRIAGDRLNNKVRQRVINKLDAKSNRQQLVQTVSVLGTAGLIAIISLLKL